MRHAGKIERVYLIHQLNMNDQAGGILHVIGLVKGLLHQGIKVIVVAPKYGEGNTEFPFPVHRLPIFRWPQVLKILSYELALAVYLLRQRELWAKRAAIYVRRGTLLLVPLLIARALRVISVVEENGIDWALELGKLSGIARKWHLILRQFNRWAFQLATFIVVPTEGMRQYLAKIFPGVVKKTFVVPNGVDTEVYRPRDIAEVQKELGLSPDKRYVCYVGHFYPGRGLEILIETLPKIIQRIPRAQVLMVGDGPLRKMLEEKVRKLNIEKYAFFTGFQPPERAALYIAASEVCLAPFEGRYQRVEVSPLKLYSYMACARPVVISDIPIECKGLSEAARIVPPEQPDIFAEAVINLLNNPEEARRMGERGRQTVEESYTWDVAAKKVLMVLDRGEKDQHEEQAVR